VSIEAYRGTPRARLGTPKLVGIDTRMVQVLEFFETSVFATELSLS
jgi:hypothetical protein